MRKMPLNRIRDLPVERQKVVNSVEIQNWKFMDCHVYG